MQFNVFNNELEELTVNPQSLTAHCWIWHCFYPVESNRKPRTELSSNAIIHIMCALAMWCAPYFYCCHRRRCCCCCYCSLYHNNTRQHSTHQQWYLFRPKLPPNQYNNRQPIVRIYMYVYIVSGEISSFAHRQRHCVQRRWLLVCLRALSKSLLWAKIELNLSHDGLSTFIRINTFPIGWSIFCCFAPSRSRSGLPLTLWIF